MLSAPDAPAPTAMARIATTAEHRMHVPGAITRPTSAVNTTSDITRGFSSATKSPTVADRDAGAASCALGDCRAQTGCRLSVGQATGVAHASQHSRCRGDARGGAAIRSPPSSVLRAVDARQRLELVERRRRRTGSTPASWRPRPTDCRRACSLREKAYEHADRRRSAGRRRRCRSRSTRPGSSPQRRPG